MNRYQGNTGRFVKVADPWDRPPPAPVIQSVPQYLPAPQPAIPVHSNPPAATPHGSASPGGLLGNLGNLGGLGSLGGLLPSLGGLGKTLFPGVGEGVGGLFHGVGDGLGKLLSRNFLEGLELEDIILALVLYLMYRESGDIELLFILGAMIFL